MLLASNSLTMIILVFAGIGAAVRGFEQAARNHSITEFGMKNLPVRIALAAGRYLSLFGKPWPPSRRRRCDGEFAGL